MIFSLIVPVFNASRYLKECLDSIRGQTFDGWECLCVDDASTDASVDILKKYARDDSRFRVVTLPRNAGVSAARNYGLDCAHGECIGFVDADDIVSQHWLEAANDAFAQGVDMVKMSISRERRLASYVRAREIAPLSGYDVFDCSILRGGLTVQNFYRRTVLRDVRFKTGMKVYEDAIFNLEALLNVKTAVSLDFAGYWYRESATSAWKRRTAEDIVQLIRALEVWYKKAEASLRQTKAEELAKSRMATYVTSIVQDFITHSQSVDVGRSALFLAKECKSLERELGVDLSKCVSFGKLKTVKRYAYSRFIHQGRWRIFRALMTVMEKLKRMRP